jgi:putative ABC transport system permease protein
MIGMMATSGWWVIAARGLWKRPGYCCAAVLTLALGIGTTTAMFTAVHGVLLKPLAGEDSGRLVTITQESSRRALNMPGQDNFLAWQKEAKSFESIAGQQNCPYTWTSPGQAAEQIFAPCVTSGYLSVYGIRPFLGRDFLPGELRAVILDHGLWRQRFQGKADVIGRELLLDKQPYRIVGVLPPEFHPFGLGQTKFWVPFDMDRNPASVNVIARLRPGATLEQARAEMAVFDTREPGRDVRTHVTPLLEHQTAQGSVLLWTLFGASGFVLLLACVNTASLMLVRGAGRRAEFAIRRALGASRSNLIRLAMQEALLISVPGALLGLGLAWALIRWMSVRLAALPRAEELALDPRAVAFAAVVAVLAALLAAVLPAIRETAAAAGQRSPRRGALQRLLPAVEIALALVLLSGAALLLRSFDEIRRVDLGYRPENVWTAFFSLPETSRENESAVYARLREQVSQIPGVESAATGTALPMGGVTINMLVYREGEDISQPKPNEKGALMQYISPGYLRTAGIALRHGRDFDARIDRKGTLPVALVSENLARRYFGGSGGGRDAIGKRLRIPQVRFDMQGIVEWELREIVGVTGSIRRNDLLDRESMDIYIPEAQNPLRLTYLLVRTNNNSGPIRQLLADHFPELPSSDKKMLAERQRDGLAILATFGGLALLLAATGVFAVVSYSAGQREKEMGIRLAVGASPAGLRRMVLLETLRTGAAGIVGGLVAVALLSRWLESLLFGVHPSDPLSHAASAAVLLACSALAAWRPATKASRTDPASSLRAA